MTRTRIDPRELADLARLELDDAEAHGFVAQLETIVGYLETLRTVDIEGVPEHSSAARDDSGLAADEPAPMLRVAEVLAGAARVREGWIEVPKIKSQ